MQMQTTTPPQTLQPKHTKHTHTIPFAKKRKCDNDAARAEYYEKQMKKLDDQHKRAKFFDKPKRHEAAASPTVQESSDSEEADKKDVDEVRDSWSVKSQSSESEDLDIDNMSVGEYAQFLSKPVVRVSIICFEWILTRFLHVFFFLSFSFHKYIFTIITPGHQMMIGPCKKCAFPVRCDGQRPQR
jgi:hypothetical protein